MAVPTPFQQQNKVIAGDPNQGILDLPAHVDYDTGVITGCFLLTPEEIAEVALTGRVWVQSLAPRGNLQPMKVSGENPLR